MYLKPLDRVMKMKRFINWCYSIFILLYDTVFLLLLNVRYRLKKKIYMPCRRVLIVRLDALGDFVLWLGYGEILLSKYPRNQYKITLICNNVAADLAAKTGLFDKIIVLRCNDFYKNMQYRSSVLSKVFADTFEVVINPTYSREWPVGDTIVRFSRSNSKIGFRGDHTNISWLAQCFTNKWYTSLVPAEKGIVMELRRNQEFLVNLGYDNVISQVADLRRILSLNNITDDVTTPYFIVVPGAGYYKRCWPESNFAEIIRRTIIKTGWTCVLLGSKNEMEKGEKINSALEGLHIVNNIGKTSVIEYVKFMTAAKMVLANESSAIHIAAALNVPVVSITGGGHFSRFATYDIDNKYTMIPLLAYHPNDCFNCKWHCLKMEKKNDVWPCILQITVEDVWTKACNIMNDNMI